MPRRSHEWVSSAAAFLVVQPFAFFNAWIFDRSIRLPWNTDAACIVALACIRVQMDLSISRIRGPARARVIFSRNLRWRSGAAHPLGPDTAYSLAHFVRRYELDFLGRAPAKAGDMVFELPDSGLTRNPSATIVVLAAELSRPSYGSDSRSGLGSSECDLVHESPARPPDHSGEHARHGSNDCVLLAVSCELEAVICA